MILLDTNAALFLLSNNARARPLRAHAGRLALSPISILEAAFLVECKRIAFPGAAADAVMRSDPRWSIDDPTLDSVIAQAMSLSWTRDPFDRLIAAHALARGWRLATSDKNLIRHLPGSSVIAL